MPPRFVAVFATGFRAGADRAARVAGAVDSVVAGTRGADRGADVGAFDGPLAGTFTAVLAPPFARGFAERAVVGFVVGRGADRPAALAMGFAAFVVGFATVFGTGLPVFGIFAGAAPGRDAGAFTAWRFVVVLDLATRPPRPLLVDPIGCRSARKLPEDRLDVNIGVGRGSVS